MADNDENEDQKTEETPESGNEQDFKLDEMASDTNEGEGEGEGTIELLGGEEPVEPMKSANDLEAVYDVPVQLSAVLGKASMQVSQLLKLGRGAVVELDRKVGEAIDIYVNNRLVARGEVVVVEERLGVTMTEIIKSDRAN